MRLRKNSSQAATVRAQRVRVAACISFSEMPAFLRSVSNFFDTMSAPGLAAGGAFPFMGGDAETLRQRGLPNGFAF